MGNFNWWTVGCYFGFALLAILIVAPGFMLGRLVSKRFNEERKQERAKREGYAQAIRENGGLVAPVNCRDLFGKILSW